MAFYGQSDNSLSSVGVHGFDNIVTSRKYGGTGSEEFYDNVRTQNSPVVGILSITVWSADNLDVIQMEICIYHEWRNGSGRQVRKRNKRYD